MFSHQKPMCFCGCQMKRSTTTTAHSGSSGNPDGNSNAMTRATDAAGRDDGDTFANAIWPLMVLAQCFGLMPVGGIARRRSLAELSFRWRSLRTLWAGSYLTMSGGVALLYLRHISAEGINAKNIVGLVFFSLCWFCGLLFLFLAQRWRDLMLLWARMEAVFVREPYIRMLHHRGGSSRRRCWADPLRLSTKIRLTATVFLSLALVEHFLFYTSALHGYVGRIRNCNFGFIEAYHVFVERNFPHIFGLVPYNGWISLVVLCYNFAFTFAWNFMDVFIMAISIGISTRFQQINRRLADLLMRSSSSVAIANVPAAFVRPALWREVREHYVQLCELLESVDANLAAIILLSCANNLYFICFQLLNIFNKLPHYINEIYFWYSLLYLIVRTAWVFLSAAAINDASRKPLLYIRVAHTAGWCADMERLSEQIASEVIALSGMRFFYMTRKLLFGMAGTIVTYELVLLQIDAGGRDKDHPHAANDTLLMAAPPVVDPCVH